MSAAFTSAPAVASIAKAAGAVAVAAAAAACGVVRSRASRAATGAPPARRCAAIRRAPPGGDVEGAAPAASTALRWDPVARRRARQGGAVGGRGEERAGASGVAGIDVCAGSEENCDGGGGGGGGRDVQRSAVVGVDGVRRSAGCEEEGADAGSRVLVGDLVKSGADSS